MCRFERMGRHEEGRGEAGRGTLDRGDSTDKGMEARASLMWYGILAETGRELAQTPETLSTQPMARFWDCPIGNTLFHLWPQSLALHFRGPAPALLQGVGSLQA